MDNPLPRLREIRDLQRAAAALTPERDKLIRTAVREGRSEKEVATAAGLSQARISQLSH